MKHPLQSKVKILLGILGNVKLRNGGSHITKLQSSKL